MNRRQTSSPRQWLIADAALGDQLWRAVRRLPRGSGILVLYHELSAGQRERLLRRLRRLTRGKGLEIVDEAAGDAVRVHGVRELRRALFARTSLILLSPVHATASHPGWRPLPRMRAAALARLSRRGLVALGGMDERRFRRLKPLGFLGWAGISAFRT